VNKQELKKRARNLADKLLAWGFPKPGADITVEFKPQGIDFTTWHLLVVKEFKQLDAELNPPDLSLNAKWAMFK